MNYESLSVDSSLPIGLHSTFVRGLNCLVDICIFEHDERIIAAELKSRLRHGLSANTSNLSANIIASNEPAASNVAALKQVLNLIVVQENRLEFSSIEASLFKQRIQCKCTHRCRPRMLMDNWVAEDHRWQRCFKRNPERTTIRSDN